MSAIPHPHPMFRHASCLENGFNISNVSFLFHASIWIIWKVRPLNNVGDKSFCDILKEHTITPLRASLFYSYWRRLWQHSMPIRRMSKSIAYILPVVFWSRWGRNAIYFALGTLQFFFFTNKDIIFFKDICIFIIQDPKCPSFWLKILVEYR